MRSSTRPAGSLAGVVGPAQAPGRPGPRQEEQTVRGASAGDQAGDAWEAGYAHLQDFAQREGHAAVPGSHCESDGYRLGQWVDRQRRSHLRERLPAERAWRLAALPGWSWGRHADAWESGFAHLQDFARREGHAAVPRSHCEGDGYRLGKWVGLQRHARRQGTLRPERAGRLAALPGWSWGRHADAWEAGYAHLQDFARREGHAAVPRSHCEADGYRLGRWAERQRDQHAREVLAGDRARSLAALPGWTWDAALRRRPPRHDDAWEAGFARLQVFAAREGHAAVPVTHRESDGYRLGPWVSGQRSARRQGTLAAQRAERLAALPGWSWDARAGDWEDGLSHLQDFARREGHARVAASHRESDGYRLGQWVHVQRRRHREGTLPPERAGRLAAVPGWTWDPRGGDWEDGFARLLVFAAREGHAAVPVAHRESDGCRLGRWAQKQRGQHARGVLAGERARRLAALPGWIWDSHSDAWESGFARLQAFARREGHACVPATHRESDGYQLGTWVRAQRYRCQRGILIEERAARLAALPGWSWALPRGGGTRQGDGAAPGAEVLREQRRAARAARTWEAGFAHLQAFAAREGHARVPLRHLESDRYPLGQWVSVQRRARRQDSLLPERAGRLTALPGWCWDTHASAWEVGFAHLEAFAAREGHARVPARHVDGGGYPVGGWVRAQRGRHARGVLPGDSARRLAALPGWSWDMHASAWEDGFARLQAFAAREGHAWVLGSHRESDGYPLGQWVSVQRGQHRRGALAAGRVRRLEALPGWSWDRRPGRRSAGSVWSASDDGWDAALARLQDFARREGHARVPNGYRSSDGYQLGDWVRLQRRSYRHGRLAADRAGRLAALPGWSFDPRDGGWDKVFARLERCAQRDGLSDISSGHRDDDLGRWVREQRRKYAGGSLADRRVRRLEALPGWSWTPPATATRRPVGEDAWADGFARLEAFTRREGHARVPGSYRESDGYWLGHWVTAQRRHGRKGTLEAERAGRLAALPGWSFDPLGDRWDEAFARLERYAQRAGSTSGIGVGYRDDDGFRLGNWVNMQRGKHARGALTDDRARRLEALPGWAWDRRGANRRSAHRNT